MKTIDIAMGINMLSESLTGFGVIKSISPNIIAPNKAWIHPTNQIMVPNAARDPAISPSTDFLFQENRFGKIFVPQLIPTVEARGSAKVIRHMLATNIRGGRHM